MNHHTNEDIIGVFSGVIGFVISKVFTAFKIALFVPSFLPSISEAVHSIVMAVLCAMAGFITTRICHFIFVKLKSKFYAKNTEEL